MAIFLLELIPALGFERTQATVQDHTRLPHQQRRLLRGPPFELLEAYQRAIDGGLRVSAFEVGPTRDLTDPLDLVKENFPYLSESE